MSWGQTHNYHIISNEEDDDKYDDMRMRESV